MTRYAKRFAVLAMAAGLALPAIVSRAEDKVPTPPDSATGVPGSNTNTVGGNSNLNKGPTGSTGAVNTQHSDRNVKLDSMDQQFVLDAANGGLAEVQLGKLAQEKGHSQAVKDFGRKMEEDHQKANDQLKTIASNKGITIPTELTGEEREHYDKLAKYNGAEFDKKYTEHMIKDHRKDISDFRKEADKGHDADIKAFASDTLPTLRDHLKQIREVAASSGDTDLARMASEKLSPDETDTNDTRKNSNIDRSNGAGRSSQEPTNPNTSNTPSNSQK